MRSTPALLLYSSNRSERLVDELAQVLRQPLADPLTTEVIVVQSRGMERWLAMELSRRLGVFANARFPFPRHLVDSIYEATAREPVEPGIFEEHTLSWAIAALLPELLGEPAFAAIAGYLEGDCDGSRRLQLSQRIARVFDDYGVYRPKLLADWERGRHDDWDAQLWRALRIRHRGGHQAARAERCVHALSEGCFDRDRLPDRLCVFGIPTLPPLYLRVLSALSGVVPTHLFVLSPSKEYFADLKRREGTGHPLLASLGRLGGEFQDLLVNAHHASELDRFVEPGSDSLLHVLQSDLLAVRDRGANPNERSKIEPNDRSIAIHVCHSPMREVEALHDQLTELMQDPRLEPHEIVVMTPDIERYAPAIEAVFSRESGRPVIPYSVADRSARGDHAFLEAVFTLVQALSSRMSASTVLDLASGESVRRRFGIEVEELERVRRWIEDSGIRWGADARHRAEEQQPETSSNTWQFGLDRMLLGYAMEGGERALFQGVLPYDGVEGAGARLLGKLAELCGRLFFQMRALREPRTAARWREDLLKLFSDLLDPGPSAAHELALVSTALSEVVERSERAGFADPIDRRSVLGLLERALNERGATRGLFAHGVTFCQLVPMRSIPFKVVCLIGMDDGVFPGRSHVLGFDRMAAERQREPGDRSRRDDDRYMFLEALLSARERLLVSYVGRSVHDNRTIPPSVVVQELLDAIDRGFLPHPPAAGEDRVEDDDGPPKLSKQLTTIHRLHAFSPRYFEPNGSSLFSYSEHHCRAANVLAGERTPVEFASANLPESAAPLEVTLDDLTMWLTRPLETFMRRSLGVHLGKDVSLLEDREPLRLDNLERWQLATDTLELLFEDVPMETIERLALAGGSLPGGALGEHAYRQVMPAVRAIHKAAIELRQGAPLQPLPVDITVDGVRITGSINRVWPRAHLRTNYSELGRRYEFEHFVRHAVLCCVLRRNPRAGYPSQSVIIGRAGKGGGARRLTFDPLEDPERVLTELLRIQRRAQREPLPFFYEISRAYAGARLDDNASEVDSDAAARKAAQGRLDTVGRDPYVDLVFGDFGAMIDRGGAQGFAGSALEHFGRFMLSKVTT